MDQFIACQYLSICWEFVYFKSQVGLAIASLIFPIRQGIVKNQ